MKKLFFSVVLFLLILFFNSCKNDSSPVEPTPQNSVAGNVKTLPQTLKDQLISISRTQDTLTFNGNISGISKNDIIVADVGDGVLRKISDIKTVGGKTLVTTTQASLVDAFKSLSVVDSFTVNESMLKTVDYKINNVFLSKSLSPNELTFKFKDAVIYDIDKNPLTQGDQVTATGELTLQLKPRLEVKISDGNISKLKVTLSPTGIVKLDFNVPLEFPEFTPEPKLLATINTKPTVLFILGVPVVITNQIPIYIGVKGTSKLKLTTGIQNTTSLTIGVNYENGKWTPINSFKNDFKFTEPTLNGECKLRAFVEPRLEMKLYGVVGPRINIQGYAEGEGVVSLNTVSGKKEISAAVYGGIEAGIGVIMQIFDIRITSYDSPALIQAKLKLWEKKWVLNSSPNIPSNPSPLDNSTNKSLSTVLNWNCSDPDNDPLKYDLYFGQQNPPATKLSAAQTSNSYNVSGLNGGITYYWQVFAKDSYDNLTSGPVWKFTTSFPPSEPNTPDPYNNQQGINIITTLSWKCSDKDNDQLTYDLLFGTQSIPTTKLASNISTLSYTVNNLELGKVYYWQVVAKDGQGNSTNGPIWSFKTKTTNEPPNPPNSPTPANGATMQQAVGLSLKWNCSDPEQDALTYDVYLSEINSNLIKIGSTSSNNIAVSQLGYEKNYQWRITAIDSKGNTTVGPIWNFSTKAYNYSPNQPSNPKPDNSAGSQPKTITLSWTCSDPDGDALNYDVYFGENSASSKLVSNSASTSISNIQLTIGKNYFWYVVAKDSKGGSTQGPTWNFNSYASGNVNEPKNPSPADKAVNQPLSLRLSWSGGDPLGWNTTYTLRLKGGTLDQELKSLVNSYYDLANLQPNTTYSWQISNSREEYRVGNTTYGTSFTGLWWSFTTANTANTNPVASFTVTPTSGDTNTDFAVDASGSSDKETTLAQLQVRWDWENDGVWDTQYSTTKTATHKFTTIGTKTIKLEVKDSGGLLNTITKNVTVNSVSTSPKISSSTATIANKVLVSGNIYRGDVSVTVNVSNNNSNVGVKVMVGSTWITLTHQGNGVYKGSQNQVIVIKDNINSIYEALINLTVSGQIQDIGYIDFL